MFQKIKNLFKSLFAVEEPVNEAVAPVEVPQVIIQERKEQAQKQKPAAKKPQSKKPQTRNKKAK